MLPKRLKRTTIYKSPWINLYVDRVQMPSGKIIEKYHQLDYPKESVAVLLLNRKNEICFIKSLRYTTQKIQWELPSGGIEKGENILTAAKREVAEETGHKLKSLKLVYTYYPANGMSNQKFHVVFGKAGDKIQAKFDTDEVKDVHWLSLTEAKKLIAKNEIVDGFSVLPLLLYFSGIGRAKS